MNCQEAQKLIDPFLKTELNLEQRVNLVRHIKGCERCREELEFYFVVLITTDMIKEEKHSGDYREAVELILERTEQEYLEKLKKRKRIRMRFRFLMLVIFGYFCIGFRTPRDTVYTGFTSGYLATDIASSGMTAAVQAFDYHTSQQSFLQAQAYMRGDYILRLWERDYAVSKVLRPQGGIRYAVPEKLLAWDAYEGQFGQPVHAIGNQETTGYTIDIRCGYIQR